MSLVKKTENTCGYFKHEKLYLWVPVVIWIPMLQFNSFNVCICLCVCTKFCAIFYCIFVVQSLESCTILWPQELKHARFPCPLLSPGVCSNSCPLSQWCHPTISSSAAPSPLALNLSQHQELFRWVGCLHQVTKGLQLQLQHPSFQWILSADFLQDWLVWPPCSLRDPQESSPMPRFESINSSVLSLLWGPNLTFIHDYWKNHSFDYTDLLAKWYLCFLICHLVLSYSIV